MGKATLKQPQPEPKPRLVAYGAGLGARLTPGQHAKQRDPGSEGQKDFEA